MKQKIELKPKEKEELKKTIKSKLQDLEKCINDVQQSNTILEQLLENKNIQKETKNVITNYFYASDFQAYFHFLLTTNKGRLKRILNPEATKDLLSEAGIPSPSYEQSIDSYIEDFVNDLFSIPSYTILVNLPCYSSEYITSTIKISENMELLKITDKEILEYKFSEDRKDTIWLKIKEFGYLRPLNIQSLLRTKILQSIKALIGLSLITNIIKIKQFIPFEVAFNLPRQFEYIILNYYPNPQTKVEQNISEQDSTFLIHHLELTDDSKQDFQDITTKFKNIFPIFSNNNDNAQRIKSAAEWYFDSLSNNNNELLKYIQATTVLEILLGDKEPDSKTGLGLQKLLSNRCAYLICQTIDERNELIKDFVAIYDMRSDIVHTGIVKRDKDKKTDPDKNFDDCFEKLQNIVERLLVKEIALYIQNK